MQEASTFLKHRAKIEEDYGRSLQKLARTTAELYSTSEGKAGYAATTIHFDLILIFPQDFRQCLAGFNEDSRCYGRQQVTICAAIKRNERGTIISCERSG
jgi:hypothetical protein